MSEYEKGIIGDYTKRGYRFLCDYVGENTNVLNTKTAYAYGIPYNKIIRVMGECIRFDTHLKRGLSRWLMFALPEKI